DAGLVGGVGEPVAQPTRGRRAQARQTMLPSLQIGHSTLIATAPAPGTTTCSGTRPSFEQTGQDLSVDSYSVAQSPQTAFRSPRWRYSAPQTVQRNRWSAAGAPMRSSSVRIRPEISPRRCVGILAKAEDCFSQRKWFRAAKTLSRSNSVS